MVVVVVMVGALCATDVNSRTVSYGMQKNHPLLVLLQVENTFFFRLTMSP